MSALIYYTDETQIYVATDTLATTPDGTPLSFCSKAIYLPHLRLIIAGTGIAGFSNDWAMLVNNRMLVSGINNLARHSPSGLRQLWSQYTARYSLPSNARTTVYAFGFSQETGKALSYAFRSTGNFEPEVLGYGLAAKPECEFPAKELKLDKDIPRMMFEQRANQEAKPVSERLYIGGEIQGMYLTPQIYESFSLGRFPDHEQQMQDALKNLTSTQS